MIPPSLITTVTLVVIYVALHAAHLLGDHPFQSRSMATGKKAPSFDALRAGMPPWSGWAACTRHVAAYTAIQAAALAYAPRPARR